MFAVGDRLHKTIEEIEAMPTALLLETIAYYKLKDRR